MEIVYFSPWQKLDSVRRQIDRVFAESEADSHDKSFNWMPAMELLEDSDRLILKLQLAGVDRNNIDIQVTRQTVTISGQTHQTKSESSKYLHSEFNYGKFQRHISLPVAIVNSQVQANFEGGILTLILPKVEEAKNRVVKISLGDTQENTASLPEASEAALAEV